MAKKKNGFKPQLRTGNDWYETASAFQKCIRRCQTQDALHFGHDLFSSNYHKYTWKRLMTIVMEDVGLAELGLLTELVGLYRTYKQMQAAKTPQGKALAWLATAKAISITSESKKNRLVDNAKLWAMKSGVSYPLTHDPNGKEDDGLLESFFHAAKEQDEKKALVYAHNFCKSFPAKRLLDKAIEVVITDHTIETINMVQAVNFFYEELLHEKKEYHHAITLIPILLCRRETNDGKLNGLAKDAMQGKYTVPIPEYAIDFHTLRGKKKGLKEFIKEGSKVNNEVLFEWDDFYWDFTKKYMMDYDDGLVTEDGYTPNDEPQKSLFG